ncbi:ribonuclease domain-containing protein [Erwiniaceae bacterium CAU 1747]
MNKKLIIAGILALIASYAGLRPSGDPKANLQQTPPSASAPRSSDAAQNDDISELTQQNRVANYLRQHQRLPDYYIRKSEARRQGWDPSRGNLCHVLPGKAIGGDRFSNREGGLPDKAGRKWFEADVNYQCGRRGSDRMLWSSDGMIYVTRDHYRHFQQVN